MRSSITRRSLIFSSLSAAAMLGLAGMACTSILGDFSTTDGTPDGSTTQNPDTGTPNDSGPTGDGAVVQPVCEAGVQDCVGSQPRSCVAGQWQNANPCTDDQPLCNTGACVLPASCETLLSNHCGTTTKSCCSSPIAEGETFNRYNNAGFPATVSSVRLNLFEVTVARFRGFINAGRGTAASPPAVGSGAHPKVPNSGWAASYNASLLADTATLSSTVVSCGGFANANYSSTAGINDNKPMNCVTWYEAFAFCAWDGGRLPSVAELELATRGGSQQRANPWGDAGIDDQHAFLCADASACLNPSTGSMLNVGSLNNGVGRWGHEDLYGSMREYALDIWTPTPATCDDCVQLDTTAATVHAAAGGSWADGLQEYYDIFDVSTTTSSQPRTPAGGFRCAYDL